MAATLTTETVTEFTVTAAGLAYVTIYREGDVEVRCLTPRNSAATDTEFAALRLSLMGERA